MASPLLLPFGADNLGLLDCARVKEGLDLVAVAELTEAESPPPQPVNANKKLRQEPANRNLENANWFKKRALTMHCLY